MDETQIVEALRSGNLDRQATALDEAARIVTALVSESVHALGQAEAPFPIAAKIFQFGPLAIPALEALLAQTSNERVRDHTAVLLLELGSKAGVPHLLSMLEHPGPYTPMAATVLGKARIAEAAPRIRALLDNWDCASDPYTANTFKAALKKLLDIPP